MSLVCIGRSRVDMGESLTPREHEIYANHQYNGGRVKAYAKLTAGLLPVTYDGELAVRTVPMVGTGQR